MNKPNNLFLLIVLLIVLSATTFGQDTPDSSNGAIQLQISTDKTCFDLKEDLRVSIKFINTEDTPIYLYKNKKQNYLEGLEILIYDNDDKLVGEEDPKGLNYSLSPKTEDFLKLESKKSSDGEITFTLGERRVKNEGIYFLRAYYNSPISHRRVPNNLIGEKVWSLNDDAVYSSKLKIMAGINCKNRNH